MAVAHATKLCCCCGKDVSASKRYKDENGYWCVECDRWDRARRKAARDDPAAAPPAPPRRLRPGRRRSLGSLISSDDPNQRVVLIAVVIAVLLGGLVFVYLNTNGFGGIFSHTVVYDGSTGQPVR